MKSKIYVLAIKSANLKSKYLNNPIENIYLLNE